MFRVPHGKYSFNVAMSQKKWGLINNLVTFSPNSQETKNPGN